MRKYDDIERDILSNYILDVVRNLIINKIPFALAIDNWNNWSDEFPATLKDKDRFMINIKEQALDDSYADKDIVDIVIDIQGIEYQKRLDISDIHAVSFDTSLPPFIVKPYKDKPPAPIPKKTLSRNIEDKKGLEHSLKMWKLYNKEMFQ